MVWGPKLIDCTNLWGNFNMYVDTDTTPRICLVNFFMLKIMFKSMFASIFFIKYFRCNAKHNFKRNIKHDFTQILNQL